MLLPELLVQPEGFRLGVLLPELLGQLLMLRVLLAHPLLLCVEDPEVLCDGVEEMVTLVVGCLLGLPVLLSQMLVVACRLSVPVLETVTLVLG